MEIKNLDVDELIPYENNPRNNDNAVQYVAESIKQFGFKVPIVIDKNNVIVTGHTRLKAAKELGLKQVPCIVADDLTDEQIKAFRLVDNRVSEFSSFDYLKLEDELREITENYGIEKIQNFDFNIEDISFEIPEEKEEQKKEKKQKEEENIICPYCNRAINGDNIYEDN